MRGQERHDGFPQVMDCDAEVRVPVLEVIPQMLGNADSDQDAIGTIGNEISHSPTPHDYCGRIYPIK